MQFSEIRVKKLNRRYLLGNENTGETFIVNKVVVSVLNELKKGKTEDEISKEFRDYDTEYILKFLKKNQFIDPKEKKRFWKINVKPFKALFDLFFIAFFVLFIYSIRIVINNPLTSKDMFLFNGLSYVIAVYLAWIPLTLLHELSHLLIANLFGISGRIYFRIYYIFPAWVTETPFAPFLNRNKRILLHSAGIISDLFFMLLFIDIAPLFPIWFYHLFRFLAVIKLLSLVSQFNVHLKTDLYFIIEDITNSINLKKDAIKLLTLRGHIRNKKGIVIAYLISIIFGYLINTLTILYYLIPGLSKKNPHYYENRITTIGFLIITLIYAIIKLIKRYKYDKKKE